MPELRRERTVGEIAGLLGVSRQTCTASLSATSVQPRDGGTNRKACGQRRAIWLAMQADYDAWEATHRLNREIEEDSGTLA